MFNNLKCSIMQKIINKFISSIDDLNIVRKGFRILYYIMGVVTGLLPAVLLFALLGAIGINPDKFLDIFNGWSKTAFAIMLILYIGITIFVFYVTFKYWKKHGDDIVNIKNRYPNLTFVADFIHTCNNSSVFGTLCSFSAFAVLAYIFMALTGEFNFYNKGNFILYLLGVIVFIIELAAVSLIQIMVVSFITESIKRKIQVSTDLQDVADIMRSSEIINKQE